MKFNIAVDIDDAECEAEITHTVENEIFDEATGETTVQESTNSHSVYAPNVISLFKEIREYVSSTLEEAGLNPK